MIKQIIIKEVESYKILMPQEYEDVKKIVIKIKSSASNKFASLKKSGLATTGLIERHLLELPEILFDKIYSQLTEEQTKEYNTKECQRWFARKYPEFCVAEKI